MKKLSVRLLLFILAASLAVVTCASAQDGLVLMQAETGARATGMAGAFVSIPGHPDGAYYNPAAITGTEDIAASIGHNTFWENVRLESGYLTARLSKRSYLSGSIRFAQISDIELRTSPTSEPEGLFDANDVSFKAAYAHDLTDKITAGLAVGWYLEKIDAWRGTQTNFDFGVLARATDRINVGASITSLGSDLTISAFGRTASRDIPLPTVYRAGGSYRYDKYLAAIDLVVLDDKLRFNLGAEADLHESLSIRAGYLGNYDSKSFSAGVTVRQRNLSIEYAVLPFSNNLGTAHLINLTFEL